MQDNYTIQSLADDHAYREMEHAPLHYPGHAVHQGDRLVAYLWFELTGKSLEMEMIEVIHKEEGHGTAIVRHLFECFTLEQMYGTVLHEASLRPYYFWQSFGTEMSASTEEHYWSDYQDGIDVTFTLHRDVLFGSKQEVTA